MIGAVSDIVTLGEMPEEMRRDMDSWASCVSGAIEADLYLDKLRDALSRFDEARGRAETVTARGNFSDLERARKVATNLLAWARSAFMSM